MAKNNYPTGKPEVTNFGIGVTDDSDSGVDLNYIPREDDGGIWIPPTPPSCTGGGNKGGGSGGTACAGVGSAGVKPVYILRNAIYNNN